MFLERLTVLISTEEKPDRDRLISVITPKQDDLQFLFSCISLLTVEQSISTIRAPVIFLHNSFSPISTAEASASSTVYDGVVFIFSFSTTQIANIFLNDGSSECIVFSCQGICSDSPPKDFYFFRDICFPNYIPYASVTWVIRGT